MPFTLAYYVMDSIVTYSLQTLQKGSQRTDEYIRMIRDKLDLAVQKCTEAAGQEFEPSKQKDLLRVSHIERTLSNNIIVFL
jgi:hypothetical protein